MKDCKGRISLVLAQASTSANKALFLQALKRGPTYYAVAAAATERAAVTAEQRALFDAKLQQIRQSHHYELTKQRMEISIGTTGQGPCRKTSQVRRQVSQFGQNFLRRIRALEEERKALCGSVKDLTQRLLTAVITLSSVSEQQAVLVNKYNEYDSQMQTAVSTHAKIVADSMRQESKLNMARAKRENLREMLAEQESKIDEAERERASIMSAISIQCQHMEEAKVHCANMIGKVGAMSYEVQNKLDKTLNRIPSTIDVDDDDELVDAVVKACRSEALANDDDEEPINEVEENVDIPADNDAKEETIPDN